MFARILQNRLRSSLLTSRLSLNTNTPLIEQCWQCQRQVDRSECQTHCPCEKHVILPVRSELDYFRLFDFSRSFEIDTKQLTRIFRNKMKLLHPDLFTNKSDTEKQHSQDQSSLLNEAYKTLLSPLARAHYLLKLENITLEESPVQLEPDFLMRIMEINEDLAEIISKNESFPMELAIEMRQEIDDHMKQLSTALNQMDLTKARELLARLQYFNNINDKLIDLEVKHGII
ncbi:unnamed protein product [Adineta ricciae]|uniref:J domain-containing protein n=2 Tax=Adineta ricciae TaxID=249248 RepID=A0A813N903_ADIRI|nr:unnamed protein product [Adineta ricciae]